MDVFKQILVGAGTWVATTFLAWLVSKIPNVKKWLSKRPRVRSVATYAIIGAAVAIGVVFALSQPTREWKYSYQHGNYNAIGAWITKECGTRDSSGIKGFISVGAPYDVHFWCRVDRSDAVWIADTSKIWTSGSSQELAKQFEIEFGSGNTALVGLIPDSGPTILLLKRK